MFQGGVYRAIGIRRAAVIGNGFAGAENQSIGLVRALGLCDRQSLYLDYTREPPGKNVVLTIGALHQADFAARKSAASAWHAELAPLPKPLLVVNIGGPSKNCSYGVDLAKQLAAMLQNVLWSCGSLKISFSRRTPEKVSKILMREFSMNPKVYIWDGEGRNPHLGHLAWADAFVITADSVSMLSEACSIGKPVYVSGAEHCTWKFADFQNSLQERGVVRPFTDVRVLELFSAQ